ncbi:hypothetical protein [Bradyrhizobium sp.]|uniref:hypothetical protein n=1 Tax=Bradyrhizobium sp. TaxID=376 RepID=UPI001EC4744C|nr:hypothetical protein [Bradyrhizobium sp.]MBV8920031.1 hypothetical protein [Bradyrhizobium sp.]MBV9980429.1 hypothetical protein [Bradyrhizobium sp.]
MTILTDKEVIDVARNVAAANGVSVAAVSTATLDSPGSPVVEIRFVLTPGSSASIMGERSARTVSQVIQQLADKGEERFPIVRYEEKGAARP